MSDQQHDVKLRPQFTIRGALIATMFVALAVGWYVSTRRAEVRLSQLQAMAVRASSERLVNQMRERDLKRDRSRVKGRPKGILWEANLDGVHLKDASIVGGGSAFYRTCFKNANLENASLTGGGSAFQEAQFDHANLINARLTGGGSSFQGASFDNADLSGAVLSGCFQLTSFADAKLIGTQFRGTALAFQAVNIDGAQFQGSDLSALSRQDLESCYFDTPPTYDEKTRFPAGFDPVTQLWKRHK